jgi:AcrR family transcriptional regulator
VHLEQSQLPPAEDRRVRRSRSALLRATVALVAERGTAAVPVSDIAAAADVSRPVLYQHFGDRDTLLLAAALDLVRRELLPRLADLSDGTGGRARSLAVARHFAAHRRFYRAVVTSSCGFALQRSIAELIIPLNRQVVRRRFGAVLDPRTAEDLAAYLTLGWGAFINAWIVEGEDPLDPEEFTDRMVRMGSVITHAWIPASTVPTLEEPTQ